MSRWNEQERRIIREDEDLRYVFSPEADRLLAEVERVAARLGIDPDALLDYMRDRRLGQWDSYLEELLEEENGT